MTDFQPPRPYYNVRKNGIQGARLALDDMRELFFNVYEYLSGEGYFEEAFGSYCVDAGFVPGFAGGNIEAYVKLTLCSGGIWPIKDHYQTYSEDELFTVIEFLYDHVSQPQNKHYHTWNDCGWHYEDFDTLKGQAEYRTRMNVPLARYGDGWELSDKGEILSQPPEGVSPLLEAKLPTADQTVIEKVAEATARYRRHGATTAEREVAVRQLADVLEWIKPQINQALLNKDSSELFNIANNFGIRHMNQNQKMHYDKPVWLSWMFYHYLNTINACLHIVKRQESKAA